MAAMNISLPIPMRDWVESQFKRRLITHLAAHKKLAFQFESNPPFLYFLPYPSKSKLTENTTPVPSCLFLPTRLAPWC